MKPFVLQKDMIKKCTSDIYSCKTIHFPFKQYSTSNFNYANIAIGLYRQIYYKLLARCINH